MEMPRPGPGHEKLKKLVGTWQGDEQMYPSEWDPEGKVAIGKTVSRIALSGFALISNYEQNRDGVTTFTGHGVMTFDPKRDRYVLHWFDCMGTPPEVFEGRWEGEVLTMAHGGQGIAGET